MADQREEAVSRLVSVEGKKLYEMLEELGVSIDDTEILVTRSELHDDFVINISCKGKGYVTRTESFSRAFINSVDLDVMKTSIMKSVSDMINGRIGNAIGKVKKIAKESTAGLLKIEYEYMKVGSNNVKCVKLKMIFNGEIFNGEVDIAIDDLDGIILTPKDNERIKRTIESVKNKYVCEDTEYLKGIVKVIANGIKKALERNEYIARAYEDAKGNLVIETNKDTQVLDLSGFNNKSIVKDVIAGLVPTTGTKPTLFSAETIVNKISEVVVDRDDHNVEEVYLLTERASQDTYKLRSLKFKYSSDKNEFDIFKLHEDKMFYMTLSEVEDVKRELIKRYVTYNIGHFINEVSRFRDSVKAILDEAAKKYQYRHNNIKECSFIRSGDKIIRLTIKDKNGITMASRSVSIEISSTITRCRVNDQPLKDFLEQEAKEVLDNLKAKLKGDRARCNENDANYITTLLENNEIILEVKKSDNGDLHVITNKDARMIPSYYSECGYDEKILSDILLTSFNNECIRSYDKLGDVINHLNKNNELIIGTEITQCDDVSSALLVSTINNEFIIPISKDITDVSDVIDNLNKTRHAFHLGYKIAKQLRVVKRVIDRQSRRGDECEASLILTSQYLYINFDYGDACGVSRLPFRNNGESDLLIKLIRVMIEDLNHK